MKLFVAVILIFSFSLTHFSQKDGKADNFRLIQIRPSAYITFEKFGTRKPRFESESNQGIWLRFHNNTKWNLTVPTLTCRNIKEECTLFYEVAKMSNFESKFAEIPIGYRQGHVSSAQTIPSGESVLFSIPKEHLVEGLYIVLDFSYEWESNGNSGGGGGYIYHKVHFYSAELPKEDRNK